MAANSTKQDATAANTQDPALHRADSVRELLDAVRDLIIPFIRSADLDAATKHTGHGLVIAGGGPRTALVEHHPPHKLKPLLALSVPDEGRGKEGLLETVETVLRYSVNTWDVGFLDKLYAGTNAVGVISELLLAVLNTNVHVYAVSPVLTLIEKQTTNYLASLFSLTSPHAGGISQPGGSASNSTALAIARNTLYPDTKTEGLGKYRFSLFTSEHGHYSLEKAAQMFGFGSNAVKSVPVDASGRMKVGELERLVKESRARGETPLFVNATAGTTVHGSFDPFSLIADVCAKEKLWLHVDGSWGGSVVFNASYAASRLAGISRADSIAVTPHKMLGIPMTCSFLLTNDLRQFWQAMRLEAGYLFHGKKEDVRDVHDLAELTPQCGRRGDALKVWLALQYYGARHFSDLVAKGYENGEFLLKLLKGSGDFVVISPEPLPCLQVCFYFARGRKLKEDEEENSKITEEVAGALVRRGFMVDFAPGERGKFFRVVVNGNLGRGVLEGLVKGIEGVAEELGY